MAFNTCERCGGRRSVYSTRWCLRCYRLETRPPEFTPGLTAATKSYFKADADALRRHGFDERADQIDRDMERADALAMKYGFALHSELAQIPAVGQGARD